MTSSGNRTSPASYTSILPLTNVEYADRGHYTCVSSVNNTGFDGSSHMISTVNATATLSIFVAPEISAGSRFVALAEGSSSSSLSCTSYGNPRPNIQWLHSGIQLPQTQIHTILTYPGHGTSPSSYTSTLTLTNVSYADHGEYTCVANVNKTGFENSRQVISTANATTTLTVYTLPVAIPLIGHLIGYTDSSVDMVVKYSSPGFPAVPPNNITWTKTGDSSWNGFASRYSLSTDNLTLTISAIQYNDTGVYNVKLGNLAGDITVKFYLSYSDLQTYSLSHLIGGTFGGLAFGLLAVLLLAIVFLRRMKNKYNLPEVDLQIGQIQNKAYEDEVAFEETTLTASATHGTVPTLEELTI
ncbi:leucine-rich repeats and immunoglobulin-like domains protein 3 [Sycon ciliatum]|uniref:leucine-rich repeats and immunoglobulin-like domains protein 3 n=1 Tax=Sycon ciliatum TaxID=27933 RepID=UPI0031F6DD95